MGLTVEQTVLLNNYLIANKGVSREHAMEVLFGGEP